MDVVIDSREIIFWAFVHTVLLFLISGVISMTFGTLLAAMRVGPVSVLRNAVAVYVALVRNTPLLIMFMFFHFAANKIGINFNWVHIVVGEVNMTSFFAVAVVSLSLYTSVFVCEALRSGVNAVPVGQAEAARAIGLPFGGAMRHVVLPQAFRASVPPLASVQIALLKNTTIAGGFGVLEALRRMRSFSLENPGERIEYFLTFALIFVVLVSIVSVFASRLERRWRVAR